MISQHQVAARPRTWHIHFISNYKDTVLSSSHFSGCPMNVSFPKTHVGPGASRWPTLDSPYIVGIHGTFLSTFWAQTISQGKSYSRSPLPHPNR